jgi:hypothetical protein
MKTLIFIAALSLFCINSDTESVKPVVQTQGACSIKNYDTDNIDCYQNWIERTCDSMDDIENHRLATFYLGKSCPEAGFPMNCGYEFKTNCK